MAISYICGFEMGALGEIGNSANAVSIQSTYVRSGSYALRIQQTTLASHADLSSRPAGGGTLRNLFQSVRFYMRVLSLPASGTVKLIVFVSGATAPNGGGGTQQHRVRLNSTGTLNITNASGSPSVTSTNALSADGLWHRFDVDCGYNGGEGMRVYVDGVLWVSSDSLDITLGNLAVIGTTSDTQAWDAVFDDFVWYDSYLPPKSLVAWEEATTANNFGRVTASNKTAQSFTHPGGAIDLVAARLYKNGTPTDNVVIELQTDNAGEPSGTVVGSSPTFPGSSLPAPGSDMWVRFAINAGNQSSGTYWLVARRSGSADDTNYFLWKAASGYGGGAAVWFNGSIWASAADDNAFRILNGDTIDVIDYNVGLLLPVTDSADGGWVEADGAGNTNLMQSLGNRPPRGSTGTGFGTRIENSISSTTDDYDANCMQYQYLPYGKARLSTTPQNVGDLTSRQKAAGSFSLGSSLSITALAVSLKKTGSPTDTLTFDIQADSSGSPSGTNIASVSIDGSTLTTSNVVYELALSTTLAAGSYWLVISRSTAVDAVNYYSYDSTDEYVGPSAMRKTYDGSVWSADLTGDMWLSLLNNNVSVFAVQAICNDAQAITTGSPKAGAVVISDLNTVAEEFADSATSEQSMGSASSNARIGQSFLGTGNLVNAAVLVPRTSVGSPADNVTVGIQADTSGAPSGSFLASVTVAGSSLTPNVEQTFTFTTLTYLTAGTTYWLVVQRSGAVDASNYYKVRCSTTSAYASGVASEGTTGNVWTNQSYDLYFRIKHAGQTERSFDYGLPNGTAGSQTAAAMGTFPAGWGTHVGPVTEDLTVTLTSGPTVRVGKRTATTREVDVDFLGVYVMWKPRKSLPLLLPNRLRPILMRN